MRCRPVGRRGIDGGFELAVERFLSAVRSRGEGDVSKVREKKTKAAQNSSEAA